MAPITERSPAVPSARPRSARGFLLGLLLAATAGAAEQPPAWLVEPPVAPVVLGPDGGRVAWARGEALLVAPVARPDAAVAQAMPGAVIDLAWAGGEHLAVHVEAGDDERLLVVDARTLGVERTPVRIERSVHRRLRLLRATARELVVAHDARLAFEPDVHHLDLTSGEIRMVARNPGEVFRWTLDRDGRPVVAQQWRPAYRGVSYVWLQRIGSGWYPVRDFHLGQPLERLLRVAPEGWLFARRHDDHGDLAWLDPVTRELGKPVWRGEGLTASAVVDAAYGEVPGLVLVEGGRPSLLSDGADWSGRLAALAEAWPGRVPRLLGRGPGDGALLWRLESDTRPALFVLQAGAGPGRVLLEARPAAGDLEPLPRTGFSFTARDGLEISGYLTRPAGEAAGPGVVLVHGGPWSRDRWSFDAEARYLAGLGYAVLQVNFRGSAGYGPRHLLAGRRQWGLAMQEDLVDAVRHAAGRGWLDPERVCIMGASYGGYAALLGVLDTPQVFRCAVARAPVTDLRRQLEAIRSTGNRRGYLEWREMVGRGDRLAAVSPMSRERLTRPALLGHGKADRVVDPGHTQRFAGRFAGQATALALSASGHDLADAGDRSRWYAAVRVFLAEHLASPPAVR